MTVRTYGNIGTFLDEFVTEDIQKVAAQIDRELVMETPKDTVQAAGNWLVTVGTPSDATPNTNSAGAAISQKYNDSSLVSFAAFVVCPTMAERTFIISS